MKYMGEEFADSLNDMVFSPDKEAKYFESSIYVRPDKVTVVHYNPDFAPNTPQFWGMVIKAGFVHWKYCKDNIPVEQKYWALGNKKPRQKKVKDLEGLPPNVP